jgi:hypothetical protein
VRHRIVPTFFVMDRPTTPFPYSRSTLFTLRLWVEEVGEGEREVRMQVKHIVSGETRYFRDWAEVMAFLMVKLSSDRRRG